jgi:hypothetical protein
VRLRNKAFDREMQRTRATTLVVPSKAMPGEAWNLTAGRGGTIAEGKLRAPDGRQWSNKRKKVVDEEALVQCRDDPAMRRRWSSAETTADDGDVYHAHYDGGDERGDER